MSIAVMPFNAGPNTSPALARQLANFACEIVRQHTQAELESANYMAQLEGQPPRFEMVNPSDKLNEPELITQVFAGDKFDKVMDGLLVAESPDRFELTYRLFADRSNEPIASEVLKFSAAELFPNYRKVIEALAGLAGKSLPKEVETDDALFGTHNASAFLGFLEGYDALQYIERTQGAVAPTFTPEAAFDTLLKAIEADPEWEAPYITLVSLARSATAARIGPFEAIAKALTKAEELAPNDARAAFALGELYQAVNDFGRAAESFERAARLDPEEPAILARLGMVQLAMGMPANAERNFRKAMEMEGPDKPSLDLLSIVLQQTGRGHEVPGLRKAVVEANPKSGAAHAKYAMSLAQADRMDDAVAAFEQGLKDAEDPSIVKRFYAPLLAQRGDYDAAMNYYEDCLDEAPTDVPLLLEYAQTLQNAKREFEVPKVLRDALAANPDPNTRAQVQAWLIELEQPQRVEIVQGAGQKLEKDDPQGAINDLTPMRNWLGDYWKMWLLLASALNRTGRHDEAEEAARRAIAIFPACEPAFAELVAALGGQGKDEEAYQTMRYAAANIPNSLTIGINLALTAKKTGRVDEARAIARHIREATGGNEELEAVLRELEA
jgi:tetratricopeptide (TPR) repeat protein